MGIKSIMRKVIIKIPGAWNIRLALSAFRAPAWIILNSRKKMQKLKNQYEGERCFIIGNGPSLIAEDLNRLRNEYTFAANKIYKIFPQTKWRPTFYCVQDENMLREMDTNEIIKLTEQCKASFIRMHSYHIVKGRINTCGNIVFVPISGVQSKKRNARFWNRGNVIYDGNTVTYMSMQMAAYMGFKEIFLIGVDHNFPYHWTNEGKLEVNDLSVASHFYDGAENNIGKEAWKRRSTLVHETTAAYQAAEECSRGKGFRIYNATRGGKLEVFERVELDDIL